VAIATALVVRLEVPNRDYRASAARVELLNQLHEVPVSGNQHHPFQILRPLEGFEGKPYIDAFLSRHTCVSIAVVV